MAALTDDDIDATDRQLLALLLEDGRRSYADLAQQVGLSGPSVHARVRKLEERGVILGYRAVVDAERLGFGISAFVAVQPTPGYHWDDLERAFAELDPVEACHGVTGDDSYLLRVRVPDPRTLEALLRTINALEGVSSTRTQLILSTSVERQRLV